jgi:hypothetical protein
MILSQWNTVSGHKVSCKYFFVVLLRKGVVFFIKTEAHKQDTTKASHLHGLQMFYYLCSQLTTTIN